MIFSPLAPDRDSVTNPIWEKQEPMWEDRSKPNVPTSSQYRIFQLISEKDT
jgi:hypothetical protein